MKRPILTFFMAAALLGCSDPIRQTTGWTLLGAGAAVSSASGRQPFQPPPEDQDRWHKAGATNTEVVKALLECGDTSPRAPFSGAPAMTANEVVLMKLCMQESGFTADYDASAEGYCKSEPLPRSTACELGTQAPAREVNKRLSSAFCHFYPRADACAP